MEGEFKEIRHLIRNEILKTIRIALAEDIRSGDITSQALIPKDKVIQAKIVANESGILAGVVVAMATLKSLEQKIKFMPLVLDGKGFKPNQTIAYVEGNARAILSAERVALNYLSRLSGIATQTAQFIKAIKPYKTKIMDTRKTTPGLRILEKYAVVVGGGYNHRMGLYDQILIKDNHLKAINCKWALIQKAIKEARKKGIKTEVEVSNLKEFKEAIKINPDIIMLDNMSVKEIKEAAKLREKCGTPKPKLEASGGVNLKNVKTLASTGVDMISVGALTHCAEPIDFSLEVVK